VLTSLRAAASLWSRNTSACALTMGSSLRLMVPSATVVVGSVERRRGDDAGGCALGCHGHQHAERAGVDAAGNDAPVAVGATLTGRPVVARGEQVRDEFNGHPDALDDVIAVEVAGDQHVVVGAGVDDAVECGGPIERAAEQQGR
jgi:hypothetical protein